MHKVNKFEERLKDIIDENRPVIFEAKQKYFRDFSELFIEHKTYEKSELQDEKYWDQLLYERICEGLGYIRILLRLENFLRMYRCHSCRSTPMAGLNQ